MKFLKDAGKFESVIDLDVFALKKIFENRDWDEDILTALEKYAVKETGFSLSVSKK